MLPGPSTSYDTCICKFDVATFSGYGDAVTRQTLFVLDLGVKITQDVAQYPLHHVTYAYVKFEAATSNGLRLDAFTRKYII